MYHALNVEKFLGGRYGTGRVEYAGLRSRPYDLIHCPIVRRGTQVEFFFYKLYFQGGFQTAFNPNQRYYG